MDDWMRVEEAWWYTDHRKGPIKGNILHTAHGTNNLAWFIPEGKSVIDGWTVGDAEGIGRAEGVWYTEEKPMYVAREAMASYWRNELNLVEERARTIKRTLEGLGVNNENGADAE